MRVKYVLHTHVPRVCTLVLFIIMLGGSSDIIFPHTNVIVTLALQESPDHKTYFVKVHATYPALLRGAEELLIRMPIRVFYTCTCTYIYVHL